jgi:hypothetical protein
MHSYRWLILFLLAVTWSSALAPQLVQAQNGCGQLRCLYLPMTVRSHPLIIAQSDLVTHDRNTRLLIQGEVRNESSSILYHPRIEVRVYDLTPQLHSVAISSTVLSAIAPGQTIPFEFDPGIRGPYQISGSVTRILSWEEATPSAPLPLETRIVRVETSAGEEFPVVAELHNPWSVPVRAIRVVGWSMPQDNPYSYIRALPLSYWLGDAGTLPLAPQASVEIRLRGYNQIDAFNLKVAAEGTPVR